MWTLRKPKTLLKNRNLPATSWQTGCISAENWGHWLSFPQRCSTSLWHCSCLTWNGLMAVIMNPTASIVMCPFSSAILLSSNMTWKGLKWHLKVVSSKRTELKSCGWGNSPKPGLLLIQETRRPFVGIWSPGWRQSGVINPCHVVAPQKV